MVQGLIYLYYKGITKKNNLKRCLQWLMTIWTVLQLSRVFSIIVEDKINTDQISDSFCEYEKIWNMNSFSL